MWNYNIYIWADFTFEGTFFGEKQWCEIWKKKDSSVKYNGSLIKKK